MKYNSAMNFEHLIQINDPENPLVQPLTRDQLWAGLLHRVENPVPFLPGLESCTILERQANELLRELDFGPATIRKELCRPFCNFNLRFRVEAAGFRRPDFHVEKPVEKFKRIDLQMEDRRPFRKPPEVLKYIFQFTIRFVDICLMIATIIFFQRREVK